MTDMRVTTREALHEFLTALPPTAFGDTHETCLIGRACQIVYNRTSHSFSYCGYPFDVAKVVAECNDGLPPFERKRLIACLPHPTEVPALAKKTGDRHGCLGGPPCPPVLSEPEQLEGQRCRTVALA